MTHLAAGSRRGVPRIWLLPILALVLILVAISLGFFSKSVLLDLLAWWPVWLVLLVLALLSRRRRWGRVRPSALVAVLFVAALGACLTGHVRGWAVMPSASVGLNGPQAGSAATGALSARIEGVLEIDSGRSGFLYAVEPIRRGGDVGPAVATEQLQGPNIAVALAPAADPGLYTFAGWAIDLDETPTWSLSLAGELRADLTRLRLSSLQIDGEGLVSLGPAAPGTVVTVSGVFELTIPVGSPARVVGDAVVPEGWIAAEDGFESPTPGEGWVISVGQGSSLTVREG
jgi:hypothetical protein